MGVLLDFENIQETKEYITKLENTISEMQKYINKSMPSGVPAFFYAVNTRVILKNIRLERWPNGVACPRCGNQKIKKVKRNIEGKQYYYCADCNRERKNPIFHDLTATAFEGLRCRFRKVVVVLHNFVLNISALACWRNLQKLGEGISYKTIFRLFHLFRVIIRESQESSPVQSDVWEVDELYLGLRNYTWHGGGYATKRQIKRQGIKAGRGSELKTPVLMMVSQNKPREYRFRILKEISKSEIKKHIDNVLSDSVNVVYTDEFRSYLYLDKDGKRHRRIKHKQKEWVDPKTGCTTNTVEGWNFQVRAELKKYRAVSEKYLMNYLHEIAWKIGRKNSENDIIKMILN